MTKKIFGLVVVTAFYVLATLGVIAGFLYGQEQYITGDPRLTLTAYASFTLLLSAVAVGSFAYHHKINVSLLGQASMASLAKKRERRRPIIARMRLLARVAGVFGGFVLLGAIAYNLNPKAMERLLWPGIALACLLPLVFVFGSISGEAYKSTVKGIER